MSQLWAFNSARKARLGLECVWSRRDHFRACRITKRPRCRIPFKHKFLQFSKSSWAITCGLPLQFRDFPNYFNYSYSSPGRPNQLTYCYSAEHMFPFSLGLTALHFSLQSKTETEKFGPKQQFLWGMQKHVLLGRAACNLISCNKTLHPGNMNGQIVL